MNDELAPARGIFHAAIVGIAFFGAVALIVWICLGAWLA
jgi:hypothetical protein